MKRPSEKDLRRIRAFNFTAHLGKVTGAPRRIDNHVISVPAVNRRGTGRVADQSTPN